VISCAVVGALAGYLLYKGTDPTYQMEMSLTFRGDTVVTNSANQIVNTPLVNALEAGALLDDYKRSINQERSSSLTYQNIQSFNYEINRNNIYPIAVTVSLKQPTLVDETAASLTTFLNNTTFVKTIINEQHSALDTKISLIDAQLKAAQAPADTKLQWQLNKTNLQLRRQEIEGFVYIGKPHLVNNGKAVDPSRTVYVLAGLIIGAALAKLFAIALVVRRQWMN